MKLHSFKKMGFLLAFGLLLLLFWNQGSITVQAATPSFKKTEVEIAGTGETYQLVVRNKVAKSTYQWSSSDENVAKVSESGLVSSFHKGSARITCKITYPTGKVLKIYCIVTVTIPATEISINNEVLVNGAHVMRVGEHYNFNRTLIPTDSTDKTYWSIDTSNDETNPEAIRIDDSASGSVTALRRGKVILIATAANESTSAAAAKSDVRDAVIIEVIGASPEVISAKIMNSNRINVVFGTTMNRATLINSNGILSNNITVSQLIDSNGEKSSDPGTLTATLSTDLKTLTITSTKPFNGKYGITFSNSILTSDGTAIYRDYFDLSYTDTSSSSSTTTTDNATNSSTGGSTGSTDTTGNTGTDGTTVDTIAPVVTSAVLDDDGLTTIITFSEKMDFSKFNVTDAKVATGSAEALTASILYLNDETNYTFSSDGKSIRINLAGISSVDYNKTFTVTISGITDTSGNNLKDGSLITVIRSDLSQRAQARPISVTRTSYNTITATFSRAIKSPGYAYIGGNNCYGEVDANNNRQVNYTIPSTVYMYSGTQTVMIGYWDSYNVLSTDTYANQMYSFTVYFATETVRPVLTSYEYDAALRILTLTYSENVSLSSNTGILAYTLNTYTYNSGNNGYINYTKASITDNVVKIVLNDISLYGDYTIALPDGFALDYYRNLSFSKSITVSNGNSSTGAGKLAEPYSISQSSVNHSLIYIEFAEKLDVTTASDINNYSVAGASITEVSLINNSVNGGTVLLTLAKGSVTTTGIRKVSVSGLKGYNGSATEMTAYSAQVNLMENVDPALKTITYDATTKNSIVLTFTEAIKGSMIVTVQERSTGYTIGNNVTVSGTTVVITLSTTPPDGTYLKIYVQNNSITDIAGNESTINPVLDALANY